MRLLCFYICTHFEPGFSDVETVRKEGEGLFEWKRQKGGSNGRKDEGGREGKGTAAWTEMPSISQGAKAVEMALSFRESKVKEK